MRIQLLVVFDSEDWPFWCKLYLCYSAYSKRKREKIELSREIHTITPVFDEHSRILILGSFPSVKSREACFFYGHPQNRFWKVLAGVFEKPVPQTIPEKKVFLLEHRVAVWDVIASCDIEGSSDSSIKNVIPNDVNRILEAAQIGQVFVNGKRAEQLYNRYLKDAVGREAVCLPSTSPANAAWSLEKLVNAWREAILQNGKNHPANLQKCT